jgi:hypothetical protein
MRPKGLMHVSVSLLLLTAALFAILSDHYQPSTMHWAYAAVGTILGFWLRDERLPTGKKKLSGAGPPEGGPRRPNGAPRILRRLIGLFPVRPRVALLLVLLPAQSLDAKAL